MRYLLCFTSLVLFSISAFCQPKNNGKVSYTVKLLENKQTEALTKLNAQLPLLVEEVNLSLIFQSAQSMFYLENALPFSEKDKKLVVAILGVDEYHTGNSYWQDLQAAYKVVKKDFLLKEDYLLTHNFKNGEYTNWVITDETKNIVGYTCYKATRSDIHTDTKGNKSYFPIVAWFCPELPFPFGPGRYGGLPGLIMELQERLALYGVEKITFAEEGDLAILEKPNLNRISEKELLAINLQAIEQLKKR